MKRAMLILVPAILLLIAGCIDYEETLTLNADGSGTLKIHYGIEKAMMAQLDSMGQGFESEEESSESEDREVWTKGEIEEALAGTDGSVKLLSYSESEDEQWKNVDMEFSFENLADFQSIATQLELTEEMNPESAEQWSYEKQPDGMWLFKRSFGEDSGEAGFDYSPSGETDEAYDPEAMAKAMEEMKEAMKDMEDDDESSEDGDMEEMHGGDADPDAEMDVEIDMEQMMEGFAAGMQAMSEGMKNAKLRIEVTFPGEIVESNATEVKGNTAIWEYAGEALMMGGGPPEITAKVRH